MNDEDLLAKYDLSVKTNSPKKAKTENDELLTKYGLDKVTNKETPKDAWWKVDHADSSYEGTAKRLGIGIVRGAKDVIDTGAHGLGETAATIAEKVLPESYSKPIRESVNDTKLKDLTARDDFNATYPSNDSLIPTSIDAGRFVGQVAATAPLMPAKAFQAIAAGAKALPTILSTGGKVAAPLANRLVSASGQGALGGAVFNAATSSANDKTLYENVGEGALTGGLAGPLLTVGAAGGKGLASRVAGRISPERAELARKASDYGINLEAGQVSNSSTWKKFNQISGMVPFSGAPAASEKQIGQFNKAIAKTFGEDTSNITPDILKQARSRIGNDYETVARNTIIQGDRALATDLSKVISHADEIISDPNQLKTFHNQLDNILNQFKNGQMTGEKWQAMRKTTEPLTTLANANKNTTLGQSIKGLILSMDNAFNRSAPQDMQNLLKQANSQWKSMKTVEKLANMDAEGHVSPLKLMSKVVNSPYGGKAKAGALGDLADIGRAFFPQPADSGTPLGEAIINKLTPAVSSPVTGIAAGLSSIVSGAPILHTAEAVVGALGNRYVRKALNSAKVRNSIIENAEGANYGMVDKATEKLIPYSGNLLKKDKNDYLKLPAALEK